VSLYVYGSVTARVTSTQQMAYGTITDYIKIGASFKYATFTETPQLFLLLKVRHDLLSNTNRTATINAAAYDSARSNNTSLLLASIILKCNLVPLPVFIGLADVSIAASNAVGVSGWSIASHSNVQQASKVAEERPGEVEQERLFLVMLSVVCMIPI
jgi:hypothetical protein